MLFRGRNFIEAIVHVEPRDNNLPSDPKTWSVEKRWVCKSSKLGYIYVCEELSDTFLTRIPSSRIVEFIMPKTMTIAAEQAQLEIIAARKVNIDDIDLRP